MKLIIMNYDEFKEFIESITDEYEQTYKGDWDWRRITSYEVQDNHILEKNRYYDNCAQHPEDNDRKILPFKIIETKELKQIDENKK